MARKRLKNKVLEDHGNWLLVDISTPKHPEATMAIDTDVFEAHNGGRIYAYHSAKDKYIYAMHKTYGKAKPFHRDVIECGKLLCDHIKHGSMSFVDNRISNLRVVNSSQNCMNAGVRSNSSTGITGVKWHKENSKWLAGIKINGKYIHLGCFDNIDIAIGVRQQAEREYFGEFAYNGGAGQ